MPSTTPDSSEAAPIGRAERALALAAIVIAAIAFLCLLVVFVAPLVGLQYGEPPAWYWDALMAIGYYGFPVAFLCVVALLVLRMISNRRANR